MSLKDMKRLLDRLSKKYGKEMSMFKAFRLEYGDKEEIILI